MWIDDGGVAHTVALTDPTNVISDDFRKALDAIAQSGVEALRRVVRQAEKQLYGAGWLEVSTSEEYVGAAPPVDLLRGHPLAAREVSDAIEQTDLRWRLDVIMALE